MKYENEIIKLTHSHLTLFLYLNPLYKQNVRYGENSALGRES